MAARPRPASDEAREALRDAMARLANGDQAALEEIYRATRVKLFGICLRILGDRKEAEDALQDVYVNLWQRADRYDPTRASPIAWLAAFARNRAIDRLRAKKKIGTTSIEEAAEIADATPLADTQLIEEADDRVLHDCIQSLDTRDAFFIRSAFIGGSTYADLAENEGQPLGTVKSRIRRALLKLRGCMEGAA